MLARALTIAKTVALTETTRRLRLPTKDPKFPSILTPTIIFNDPR
uniref:Uncharacterized protein n=1 Tax=Anguilla anguilla TaxID=7936 RepID=A0A0E9SH13_ANGAN